MEKTQISLIEMKNKVVELLLKYDPEVKDHTTRSRMRFLAIMALDSREKQRSRRSLQHTRDRDPFFSDGKILQRILNLPDLPVRFDNTP